MLIKDVFSKTIYFFKSAKKYCNIEKYKDEQYFLKELIRTYELAFQNKKNKFNRGVSFGDCFVDRWQRAKKLGFGENSSVYDNVLVLGDVTVGSNTWIGPNVVLDGSGGLEIGSYCSISTGVQIYSHDNVKWTISGGRHNYEYSKTIIEDNCYIGPNCIIQKGVRIQKCSIIGANSFVNKDIPPYSKAYGTPARIICTEKK